MCCCSILNKQSYYDIIEASNYITLLFELQIYLVYYFKQIYTQMYTESYMQKRGNKLILQPENIKNKKH